MKEKEDLDEELEGLGLEFRRLPTPRPPDALVSRVRRLAHSELAARDEERFDRQAVAFLLFFSWTVTAFYFLAVRLLSGAGVSRVGSVYFVSAWIAGAAVLPLLRFHVRQERGLA